jgi:hypothetical protein
MAADTVFAQSLRTGWRIALLHAIGFVGVTAILFDYLQYLFGARSVEEALKDPESKYNELSCAYKARILFFNLKQWTVGIGAVLLIAVIFVAALSRP